MQVNITQRRSFAKKLLPDKTSYTAEKACSHSCMPKANGGIYQVTMLKPENAAQLWRQTSS